MPLAKLTLISLMFCSLMICVSIRACEHPYRTLAEPDSEGKPVGIETLQKVMDLLHCQLTITVRASSHDRRMQLVRDGEIDVLAEASIRPERALFAWFSHPYRNENTYFYVRNVELKNYAALTLADISKRRIRVLIPAAGWYGPEIDALRPQWEQQKLLRSYGTILEALREMRMLRADVMIGTDLAYDAEFSRGGEITRLKNKLYSNPVVFLLSKKNLTANDVADFDRALDEALRAKPAP